MTLSKEGDGGETVPLSAALQAWMCSFSRLKAHTGLRVSPMDFEIHFSSVNFVTVIFSHSLAIGCLTVFVFVPFIPP